MRQEAPNPWDLVLTQTELMPQHPPHTTSTDSHFPSDLQVEIKKFSDRVGGLAKLRALLGILPGFEHRECYFVPLDSYQAQKRAKSWRRPAAIS